MTIGISSCAVFHFTRKNSNFAPMFKACVFWNWIKLLIICAITLSVGAVAAIDGACAMPSSLTAGSGELTSRDHPQAVTDDYGLVMSAPAQVPVVMPNQGCRVLTPSKYRTPNSRVTTARRYLDKPAGAVAGLLACHRCYRLQRSSSPLRSRGAVYFHVIELCRLLC